MKKTRRKFIVMLSLVCVLSVTSALLLALAPPPLSESQAFDSLSAADSAPNAAADLASSLLHTHQPTQPGHWKYIYIHQSGTPFGAAAGLGDHFLIGNGHGSIDGQIQMTQHWNNQTAAVAPPGVSSIDPDCISICLIGNLDAKPPTALQTHRVAELVSSLQGQLDIGSDKVYFVSDAKAGVAGIGNKFPAAELRAQLLP